MEVIDLDTDDTSVEQPFFLKRCLTNCLIRLKKTKGTKNERDRYSSNDIYIFRNKSFCPISKGIRNFDIYRARNISRSMISGRKKKFVFQRKGFSLICPACLKKGKRKGGKKEIAGTNFARESIPPVPDRCPTKRSCESPRSR